MIIKAIINVTFLDFYTLSVSSPSILNIDTSTCTLYSVRLYHLQPAVAETLWLGHTLFGQSMIASFFIDITVSLFIEVVRCTSFNYNRCYFYFVEFFCIATGLQVKLFCRVAQFLRNVVTSLPKE